MASVTDASRTTTFWLRHWKMIINIITITALLVLVFAIREQIISTFRDLQNVNLWILLLIIPLEVLNYHYQARLYQRLFGIVGNKLSYGFLYRVALELNFVNNIFPSGGVSGISYFSLRLRDGHKISGSRATLVHFMKLMLVIVAFEILLIIGVFALAATGKASNLAMLVAGSLSTLMVLGTLLFVYIIGSKTRINGFFTAVTRGINRIIHVARRSTPETINIARARGAFDEMHENYLLFRYRLHELRVPLFYAFMMSVTEILVVYVVYVAFAQYVNIGAIILAYAVANFSGFISVLPGGVGIYEFFMTAVLSAGGVALAISLPVTVMYRVLNTLIQLPPGYYFYHKALRSGLQVQQRGSTG